MTPALERALKRREALMRPRSDRGGGMGGLASLLGGGAPVGEFGAGNPGDVGPSMSMVAPDQGPGLSGATTGGITAPGKTHFFIRGRGPTIDFGPIFRPKSTGMDPMKGDPFRETSGVGGFFRRLLGDNSNELNAQWQQARLGRGLELADRSADWDFRRGLQRDDQDFRMGMQDTALAASGEERDIDRNQTNQLAQAQRDMQRHSEAMRAQNAMDLQGQSEVHNLIRDTENNRFRGQLADKQLGFEREKFDFERNVPRAIPGVGYAQGSDVFGVTPGGVNLETGGFTPPQRVRLGDTLVAPVVEKPKDAVGLKSKFTEEDKKGAAAPAEPGMEWQGPPTPYEQGLQLLKQDVAAPLVRVSNLTRAVQAVPAEGIGAVQNKAMDIIRQLVEARAGKGTKKRTEEEEALHQMNLRNLNRDNRSGSPLGGTF